MGTAWPDANLPARHWVCVNLRNGRPYRLSAGDPVPVPAAAKQKPQSAICRHRTRYGASVGADMRLRRPHHQNPHTAIGGRSGTPSSRISLDYLAEFCPDADLAAYSRRSRKGAKRAGPQRHPCSITCENGPTALSESIGGPMGTMPGPMPSAQPVRRPMFWTGAGRPPARVEVKATARASPAGYGGVSARPVPRQGAARGAKGQGIQGWGRPKGNKAQTCCRRCYGSRVGLQQPRHSRGSGHRFGKR